jgi:hypothetical protein
MSEITEIAEKIRGEASESWLSTIYADKVRTLRTRAFKLEIPEKENKTEIQHTLLGVELKVGNQRISCPDLAAARYLQVFARFGCSEVAIPYDITKISVLADVLESSWQRLLLLIEHESNGKTKQFRSRLKASLVKETRQEIMKIGAGSLIPEFNQNTKQRKT